MNTYGNEDYILRQCINELAWIRLNGTPEEQLGLAYTTLDEYIEWRQKNPCAAVHDYFKRPDRPQEQMLNEAKLEMMRYIKEYMDKYRR